MSKEITGIVFNIQRFSVHDGPGIRTVVFLKGCPLRCKWCANPESQNPQMELAWTRSKCIGCGECIKARLKSGLRFEDDNLYWDELADGAETIRLTCPSTALHTIGYKATADEVLKEVDKDAIFYGDEEGGITISGGEPLMQPEFTYELLKKARQEGINTSIETTGLARTEDFVRVASMLDYMLMDIKSMDDSKHQQATGVSNRQIIENFKVIRQTYPELPIHVRTPIIPGFNDNDEDVKEIADFVSSFDNVRYELLKYHRLGQAKYETLHRAYPLEDKTLDEGVFTELKRYQFNRISSQLEDIGWQKGAGI